MVRKKQLSADATEFARKGGKARAKALTKDQRKAIAKRAAEARWKGRKK